MFNKRVYISGQRIVSFIFMTVLVLGFAVSAQGQGATKSPERGFHAGGSYALSDIETISRSSGELSLSIPLGSLPAGRGGLSASLKLLYSSKIWDTTEEYDNTEIDPVPASFLKSSEDVVDDTNGGGGWRYACEYQLKLKLKKLPFDETACDTTGGYVNQLVIITPDGAQHIMRLDQQYSAYTDADGYMKINPDGQLVCPGSGTPITGIITYYSIDGTYMRLDIKPDSDSNWVNNPWELSLPDGTVVLGGKVPSPSTAFQQIKDRNGNFIEIENITYNGHRAKKIKDQLGRSIIIEYDSAFNQDKVHVTGVAQHELLWIIQWRSIKAYKNYQYSQHQPVRQANRIFKVLAQITLPEQAGSLSYTFDYNACDPMDTQHCSQGSGPSVGWGELSSIILPSGASAAYEYVQDSINGTTGSLLYPFQVLRNRPKKKTLTYSTSYEGTPEAHTEIWDYVTTYQSGSISEDQPVIETQVTGPDGGISREYPYKTSTGAYVPEETAKTINPDGTIVERLYQYNSPYPTFPTLEKANRFVKYEFTTLHDLSKTAIKEYSYDGNGNVLTVKEYDWVDYAVVIRDSNNQPTGSFNSPAPMLLRKTVNTYHVSGSGSNNYSNPNSPPLRNAIKSTEVQNGSADVLSYSEFTYDSATTTGNLTQSKIWNSNKAALPLTTTPEANYILLSNEYDIYGNVTKITDGKGYESRFTYDAITGYNNTTYDKLYPTKIEKAYGKAVQLTTEKLYDFSTGLETEVNDADNGVKTTMAYDDFGRPKLVIAGESENAETRTETVYNDEARYVIVKSDLQVAGDKKLVSITHYDQLGRVRLSRTLEDAANQSATDETIGIKVQRRYRISSPYSYTLTSNPYRATSAANQEETMGWTLTKAHNNGRSSEVESFNGGTLPQAWGGNNTASTGKVTTSITANTTTVTDQALKKRRSVVDGLGRLIRVDEPNANGDFEVSNTLVQPTHYTYDALDNLIKVEQPTQTTPSVNQIRRYAYDSLKRLIFAANPEQATHSLLAYKNQNWAVKYEYDENSNLVKKIDSRETAPNSNQLLTITYGYDELNRIKMRTYTNDLQGTPEVTYDYDDTGVEFAQGRLTKVTTTGVSTSEYLKYDALGRVLQSKQRTSTPDGNKDYPFTYEYNRAGALTRELYPSGKAVVTEYDLAGRVAGVKKEGGDYYVGAIASDATNRIQYTAHGAVKAMKLGNGLWEHSNFNGRLQPIQIGLGTSSSNSSSLQLDYTYHTTALTNNNGNVRSQHIVVGTMDVTQTYEYDELNRLQSAEEKLSGQTPTSQWKQSFTYDRFGNRKFDTSSTATFPQSGSTSVLGPQLDFNASNNRITTSGYEYDSAGNVKQEPTTSTNKSYAYDGENHQVSYSFNGAMTHYVYDGDGKRVMKWDNSGTIVYVYDALGQLAAEYTTAAPQNNGISYLTTDHLGSTRVVSGKDGGGNANVKARYDYLPFGEELPSGLGGRNYLTDNTKQKFTGHERDPETKLDFAQARYCSSAAGRFMSVDPLLSSAEVSSPQSWNRYTYVTNNPLNQKDILGLYVWGYGATEERKKQFREYVSTLTSAQKEFAEGSKEYNKIGAILDALGKENEGNVEIRYDTKDSEGEDLGGDSAATITTFDRLPNGSVGNIKTSITFNTNDKNSDYTVVAHEVQHGVDNVAFINSITFKNGIASFDKSLDLTRYGLEDRGFESQQIAAKAFGLNLNPTGDSSVALYDRGWSEPDKQMVKARANYLKAVYGYENKPGKQGKTMSQNYNLNPKKK
jgi:RHS repeat-associated protein